MESRQTKGGSGNTVMPSRAIRRRIVFLSILLLSAIIGNAAFSTFKEYREVEDNISKELENRLRTAVSITDNQVEKMAIVSQSIREQGQKYADFLDYDKIVPISFMLNAIARFHNLDFALIYDENREVLASNRDVVQKGLREPYSPLLQDARERVGLEMIPPETVRQERPGFLDMKSGGAVLAFKSVIHIQHDTGDVYAYIVLLKLVNGNQELLKKASRVTDAEIVFYDRWNTPILSSLSTPSIPMPQNGLFHLEGEPYIVRSEQLRGFSGEKIGSLAIALNARPFYNHQKLMMMNNLIPFVISGIICLIFLWTLRRRVFEKINTLVLALRRVGREEADLRTRVDIGHGNARSTGLDELDIMCMDFNKMMERLEETHRQLKRSQAAAEAASKAKSEFLANMSHELRTPLNHIIGFTELVADQKVGNLNPDQEEYLQDVLASSQHLLSLINDILDLSKVEAGKLDIRPSEVNLGSLLEKSLIMVKEKAMKHGISLRMCYDDAPETIMADERALKQVMYNLLSNAVKFTPDQGAIHLDAYRLVAENGHWRRQGGGEFPFSEHLRDWPSPVGDLVGVTVSDTGIGIGVENLARIFDPFEQVDSSASSRYNGTGLGLSLSRKFVELHGGKIWAESEGEGKGSRFIFAIPVQSAKLF